MKNIFFDDNHHDLTWWTAKHNDYAIREAAELFETEINTNIIQKAISEDSLSEVSRNKKNIYSRMPLFLRATIYFLFRYLAKGSFLDGKEGFIWCFLQAWWYRTLVDAKIYEVKKACGNNPQKIKEYFQKHYNITL